MDTSLNAANHRDAWLDNVKGFLIVTVVIGHLVASVVKGFYTFEFIFNFIYSFHMPTFALVSGYLMKNRINKKDYISVINKTLVPYLIAQVFVYLAAMILPDGVRALSITQMYESGTFSFAFPIYQLWYFLGLVFTFLFCVLVKAEKHPVRAVAIAFIVSMLSGFLPFLEFLKITKLMAFLPFFVLGYVLPKSSMEFIKEKRTLGIVALPIVVLSGAVLWHFRGVGSLNYIFSMSGEYLNFPLDISPLQAMAIRFGYIISACLVSFSILSLCPRGKSPLTILGKRSMYVFVLHVIPLIIIRHINYQTRFLYYLDTIWLKILYLIFGVVLCYLLVTNVVVEIFKPILEPKFDVRKIGEYLKFKE